MSINHSIIVTGTQDTCVKINIPGLDSIPIEDAASVRGSIFAYDKHTGDARFTCAFSLEELRALYCFLGQYSIVRDATAVSSPRIIELPKSKEEIFGILEACSKREVLSAVQELVNSNLTRADINMLTGRHAALAQFGNHLEQNDLDEPKWQRFFKANDWFFGFGLCYKYLGILQREAYVSSSNVDGKDSVISDFLMSDSRFTVLVELKTPTTDLFEAHKIRSQTWSLSRDLTYAVSQILTQKAEWELKAKEPQYLEDGSRMTEEAFDVRCILIIGMSNQFSGTEQEAALKRKTFELYRRNCRNIEILLYDEVYERASILMRNNESAEAI